MYRANLSPEGIPALSELVTDERRAEERDEYQQP